MMMMAMTMTTTMAMAMAMKTAVKLCGRRCSRVICVIRCSR